MAKNIEKTDPSELQSHLGYHLRLVSNAVSQAFAKKLAETGVTVAEWVILREMFAAEGSTSPSVVAEITGLTRGAVSKLIDRLLDKKLVLRSESQKDRRCQKIKLTAEAIKLVPKLAKIADENDQNFFSLLTKNENTNLKLTLTKLAAFHKLNTSPIN